MGYFTEVVLLIDFHGGGAEGNRTPDLCSAIVPGPVAPCSAMFREEQIKSLILRI